MKILQGIEEEIAYKLILQAAEIWKNATCKRAKWWSIIVKDWEIIWTWYNSPANNLESQRRCHIPKDSYHKKVTDKTCCVHAEQRAIMDALKNNPQKLHWSRIYYIRLDWEANLMKASSPYCTICSKMALDVWITEFVLYDEKWIICYNTQEYNQISYLYNN